MEWLVVLEAVCRRLDELHEAGIVHCNLNANNVIVTLSPVDAHIINYSLSTRVSNSSVLGRLRGWKRILAKSPWYAPETLRGAIVTPATDVVGLASIIGNAGSAMTRGLPTAIKALLVGANSHDTQQRPSVTDFANAFARARKELQTLSKDEV